MGGVHDSRLRSADALRPSQPARAHSLACCGHRGTTGSGAGVHRCRDHGQCFGEERPAHRTDPPPLPPLPHPRPKADGRKGGEGVGSVYERPCRDGTPRSLSLAATGEEGVRGGQSREGWGGGGLAACTRRSVPHTHRRRPPYPSTRRCAVAAHAAASGAANRGAQAQRAAQAGILYPSHQAAGQRTCCPDFRPRGPPPSRALRNGRGGGEGRRM